RRRRHTRFSRDWSSDVCSSDLGPPAGYGDVPCLAIFDLDVCRPGRVGVAQQPAAVSEDTAGHHPVSVPVAHYRNIARPAELEDQIRQTFSLGLLQIPDEAGVAGRPSPRAADHAGGLDTRTGPVAHQVNVAGLAVLEARLRRPAGKR